MQGRWSWAKSSIFSMFSSVTDATKTVGGVVKNIWQSETLRANAQTFSLQAWSGISFSSFLSSIPVSIQYAETRAPLWGQAPAGMTSFGGFIPDNTVILAAEVLLVEQLFTKGLRLIPGVEGSYLEYGLYALDAAAYLYLLRQSLNKKINNVFYQMAITKEATPDLALLQKQFHKHLLFKPCTKECGETASIMADVMRIPENLADTIFSYSVANACSLLMFSLKQPLPYINALVLYPLLALKYGRDILNAKLSSVGMCENHRNEIITANNAYCIGKGASLLFGVYATPRVAGWLLEQYGYSWAADLINSEFIASGLFAYGYMSYAQAELQITNTLPGTKPGTDVFKYVHVAAQAATMWTVSSVVSLCWDPSSTQTWDDTLVKIKETYQSAPIKLAMTVCVGTDASSLRAFLKRPAVHSFISAYEDTFKESVEWINGLRSGRIPDFVLKILPNRVLSRTTKDVLFALRSKDMDGPAKSMNDILDKTYPGAFPYIAPKKEPTSLIRAETAAKLREDKKEKPVEVVSGPLDRAEQKEKARDIARSFSLMPPSLSSRVVEVSSARHAPLQQPLTDEVRAFLVGNKGKYE